MKKLLAFLLVLVLATVSYATIWPCYTDVLLNCAQFTETVQPDDTQPSVQATCVSTNKYHGMLTSKYGTLCQKTNQAQVCTYKCTFIFNGEEYYYLKPVTKTNSWPVPNSTCPTCPAE